MVTFVDGPYCVGLAMEYCVFVRQRTGSGFLPLINVCMYVYVYLYLDHYLMSSQARLSLEEKEWGLLIVRKAVNARGGVRPFCVQIQDTFLHTSSL